LVIEASQDQDLLNQLIEQHEFFILKSASAVTHHYVTKSDDEWSIALIAFVQAVHDYNLEKGNFIRFAKLVMTRRLVDYIRGKGRHSAEVSVDPIVFDTDSTDDCETDLSIQLAVAEQVSQKDNTSIQLEISAVNDIFSNYGFSFFDLTDCSPHASKTKLACAKAIRFMMQQPLLLGELRKSKQLPIKIIEKNEKIPRKMLERHRKYIIAAIEILSGEYPNLAEYLRYIREEN
jgi:RNA polymerase sigma factor